MAELIVHNPPRAALKASGYIGSPEGDIELTENDKTYNVADFATATTRIPKPPEPTGTKEIIETVLIHPAPRLCVSVRSSHRPRQSSAQNAIKCFGCYAPVCFLARCSASTQSTPHFIGASLKRGQTAFLMMQPGLLDTVFPQNTVGEKQ